MHYKALVALLLAAATCASPAPAQQIDSRTQARIAPILRSTPLIDGHNDLPGEIRDLEFRVEGLESGGQARPKPLMTDMAGLRAGRVGGQFWSAYISGTITGDEAIRTTIEQIDIIRRLVDAYPQHLGLALTADDIVRVHKSGRTASLIGIEGGRQIGGSLAALRQFYNLGARYMTLTHNQTTEWADSATDEPKYGGLSPVGVEVVGEMNRLGILVDLSHVSAETMKDAIQASQAPVIWSHSNAFAINPHPRNVPDDVLTLLPAKGGVVMVNFYPAFLSPQATDWARRRAGEEARIKATFPFSTERVEAELLAWERANPRPAVGIGVVADHLDHIVRVAGYDHVGLGGDHDGVPYTVVGLETVAGYPLIFAELIRRGWSDANLAKLAGGNILRAMRHAERVSASLRGQQPSLIALDPPR